jgi:WD40 repeat protein
VAIHTTLSVEVLDVATGESVTDAPYGLASEDMPLGDHGHGSWPKSTPLAFSPDGRLLAAGFPRQRAVTIRDAQSWKRRSQLQHQKPIHSIAFSPDGRYLATASAAFSSPGSRRLFGFTHTSCDVILWDIGSSLSSGTGSGNLLRWQDSALGCGEAAAVGARRVTTRWEAISAEGPGQEGRGAGRQQCRPMRDARCRRVAATLLPWKH